MACIIREDGKTYRLIELEHDEDQRIIREAKEAQMSVDEYIRSKVLSDEKMRCSSDWLIAYVRHGAGNSHKVLKYAQRRGMIRILRIGLEK